MTSPRKAPGLPLPAQPRLRRKPGQAPGRTGRRRKPGHVLAQLVSYGLVGGTAASVDFTCWWFFVNSLGIDYRLANFFSFTIGTFINFLLCNFFIFEKQSLSFFRACVRHYFSSIGGFLVNQTVLILLVELVFGASTGTEGLLSKLMATGCSFVFNFTMLRLYAFNSALSFRSKVKDLFS